MSYQVTYTEQAVQQLQNIHDYIAEKGEPRAAKALLEAIFRYCDGFDLFPERGTSRDDLRLGLRLVGFERKATIAIRIDEATRRVVVLGVYYGGQNHEDLVRISDERDPM
jgi:plasmid stabilization system protein ParE